jgi:hypothetical protein
VLPCTSKTRICCIQSTASAEGVSSQLQAAAAALPNMIPDGNLQKGFVYPPLDTIRCCCPRPRPPAPCSSAYTVKLHSEPFPSNAQTCERHTTAVAQLVHAPVIRCNCRDISARVTFEVMYQAMEEGLVKNPRAIREFESSNESLMDWIVSNMYWCAGQGRTRCTHCAWPAVQHNEHITPVGGSTPGLAAVLTLLHLTMRRPHYSPLIYLEPGALAKGSVVEQFVVQDDFAGRFALTPFTYHMPQAKTSEPLVALAMAFPSDGLHYLLAAPRSSCRQHAVSAQQHQ